jgi:RNA polymerase sigma factor (TIGR02999 family)
MSNENSQLEMTQLLVQLGKTNQEQKPEVFDAIFKQLRRIAHRYMQSERPDHTLQATAVVHEAYMRVMEGGEMNWQSRGHFFGVSARLMRQVLVDHARAHNAESRGSGQRKLSIDDVFVYSKDKSGALVSLDEALSRLAAQDPRMAKVVELKYFAGLNFEEIAKSMDISERTAKRDWALARAWLHGELSKQA